MPRQQPEETRFEDFCGLIGALYREIARIKAEEAEKIGFKGADVMCLYHLANHPEGLTNADLARLSDVSRAAISRTVSGLEKRGLTTIAHDDGSTTSRYLARICLTEKGKEYAAQASTAVDKVLDTTAEALPEPRRSQMYEDLICILNVLQDYDR